MPRLLSILFCLLLIGTAHGQNLRTYDELLTDFADNVTGDITPSNMRDLLASFVVYHGKASITEPTTPMTIAAQNTWYAVTGAWDNCPNSRGMRFDFSDDFGRVCNDTGHTMLFMAALTITLEAVGSNNQEWQIGLMTDDGSVLACLEDYLESRFGGVFVGTSPQTVVPLEDQECLRIAIRNLSSAADANIGSAMLILKALPPPIPNPEVP